MPDMNSVASAFSSLPKLSSLEGEFEWAALLLILLSLPLIQIWRQRDYRSKLPSYDQIPLSTLKHVANKEVLASLSNTVDVAVVGSGLGALSSAVVLAKCGYKVVVFEQHYFVGGSTHTFKDQGFEFDVGVHYVGGRLNSWSSPVRTMFDTLSDGKLEWHPLSENYDIMFNSSSEERLEMVRDPKVNRKQLLAHFSDLDPKSLDKYYRACMWARMVGVIAISLKALSPFLLRLVWPLFGRLYDRVCSRNTVTVMKECGLPEDVIGALTYDYGNIGTPPGKSPFMMHALLEGHYHGGGFFPKGGSSSIAKTLVAAITRRGGHVFAMSPVDRIMTKKTLFGSHRAVGVRVRGVDVMVKKFIISDAGFDTTFGSTTTTTTTKDTQSDRWTIPLVGHEASASQLALIQNKDGNIPLEPSSSYFLLFVGLDGTDSELDLPAQNVWHLRDWNHDEWFKKFSSAQSIKDVRMEDASVVFVSNESAKDPDHSKRNPGTSTVTIIAPAKYDWFRPWINTKSGHRGKDYDDMKAETTKFLLDVMYKHFPRTKGRVAYAELGTPLSSNKFLGRQKGEIYNLDHTEGRFDSLGAQLALHPQTTVKNLYMTGQDVFCVSVMASAFSGYCAAGRASIFAFIYYCVPVVLLTLPFIVFA